MFKLFIISFTSGIITLNTGYEEAMQKELQKLNEASSIQDYQSAVNGFERIGQVEKDEWLPVYYVSYGYTIMAAMENDLDQKDDYLNLGEQYIKEAIERKGSLTETNALQGFIYMLRVSIDPADRGPSYSPIMTASLNKALEINPKNPRAMYLMAQLKFGQAEFFGNDTKDACDLAKQAKKIIEQEVPESPLHPTWGKRFIELMLAKCGNY